MKKQYVILFTLAFTLNIISCNDSTQINNSTSGDDSNYGRSWSASHADSRNSDYSPVKGPRNITLAWQHKFAGTINLGPTNDENGRVYVTTAADGCHLYAFDNATGEILWCTDEVNEFAVASSALLDSHGRVFIGDNQAMYAFDVSGKLIWKTPIDGFPFSAQFTHTGHLIFITCIGKIYVLDNQTGKQILEPVELNPGKKYDPDMDVRACMRGTKECPCANTPAYDLNSGRFYFTFWTNDAALAGLRAMQYSEFPIPSIIPLWINESLPGGSGSSPDISSDGTRIYVNDNNGGVHAIDAHTGEIIWSFDIGYEAGGSQSTSPDGVIIPAGGDNAPLLCIADRGSKAELVWRIDMLQNRSVPTQSGGNLSYVTVKTGNMQNDIVVIDVASGSIIDRENLPGNTLFSVGTTIDTDGNIYVPTFNGYLFTFRPEIR